MRGGTGDREEEMVGREMEGEGDEAGENKYRELRVLFAHADALRRRERDAANHKALIPGIFNLPLHNQIINNLLIYDINNIIISFCLYIFF